MAEHTSNMFDELSDDDRSPVARKFDEGTIMIAAFSGWNDAGNAATNALQHIADVFEARLFDELDPEPYVDFQVNRPTIMNTEAGRHILWPSTRIEVAQLPITNRTVVLVHGVEPSMKWRTYYQTILRIADDFECGGLILLGSLIGDVSHHSPKAATVTSSNLFLQEHLEVEESEYEGPTGIVGVLSHYAELDGLPAVSTWAEVPHYVPQPPAIRAEMNLLDNVEEILGEPIPRGELEDELEAWQRGVDAFVEADPELTAYVAQLAKDEPLTEISGEDIAKEFERFLKRRDPANPKNPNDPKSSEGPASPDSADPA